MFILVQIKAILVAVTLLIFVLFPTCLIALPFGLHRRLKIVCPVWQFCSRMLLRHACQVKWGIQEDHRSAPFRDVPPYGLFVANHQSYIDIPTTLSFYQAPPIMKKEVLYIPLFGWLGWISGALPVSRSSVDSRKRVFDQARNRILSERIGLQVYPEGTRSKEARPKTYDDIKRTLIVFAYNEGIPVIPTSVYGTRGVLSSKGFIRPNRFIGVIIHKELDPKDFKTSDEFCRAVWGKVTQGYDQMQEKLAPLNGN